MYILILGLAMSYGQVLGPVTPPIAPSNPVVGQLSCIPNEPHMQFFSNPPMGEVEVIIWRRIEPRMQVILLRTWWGEECFAVSRSLVNLLSPWIKWEDNICVFIRHVNMMTQTTAQCNGDSTGVTNK
jgi:hypothetical protein